MRFVLIIIGIVFLQGCEFHAPSDSPDKWDTSVEMADKIALQMIIEQLDAKNIEYWIDDEGRLRYSQDLDATVAEISEAVFDHRHGGVWVQFDGAGCDNEAALIAILEERGIEYLVEPYNGGEMFGNTAIHWYPTEKNTEKEVSVEARKLGCSSS